MAANTAALARTLALGLTAAALLSSQAQASSSEPELQAILGRLAQVKHGHARFREQIDSPLLKRPLHTSGELFFEAPGRLEKRTLLPRPEDLILDGDLITVARGNQQRSFHLSQYPQLRPLLDGMRATLAGDLKTLERDFQVQVDQADEIWTLTLRPLPDELSPGYESIVIRGAAAQVSDVTLERGHGERSQLILTEAAGF